MRREPTRLTDRQYDLLVIGGGIQGATVAWAAARAGWDTALLERADFAQATSANSQKIIHGGLRHLSRFDLRRMRRSVREQTRMLWLAPHLVEPLRMVVPTRGFGREGPEVVGLGLQMLNLLGRDPRSLADPSRRIGKARLLSRDEMKALFPGLALGRARGGASWYDATCYNPERLVLAFVRAAHDLGATAVNYVEAESLLIEDDRVLGVLARDARSGETFEVRARHTVNCSGPWLHQLEGGAARTPHGWVAGINLVIEPAYSSPVGLGLPGLGTGGGALVVTPWRRLSILGTAWVPHDGAPEAFEVDEPIRRQLLDGLASVFPGRKLSPDSIRFVHAGLVPAKGPSAPDVPRSRPRLLGAESHGLEGWTLVEGVKLTTAADVAEMVLERVNGAYTRPAIVDSHRLPGGDIERFEAFEAGVLDRVASSEGEDRARDLARNYGSEVSEVLELAGADPPLSGQVRFAVRKEMAVRMTDVVFRRTGLGTAGPPAREQLAAVADVMTEELGWSSRERAEELATVEAACAADAASLGAPA